MFKFSITKKSPNTRARRGVITTRHGEIQTPIFMPVGTQATIKGIQNRELHEMGAEIILGNTYHLFLRPGHELIRRQGGLHQFMNWHKPILTDSGGFQVFSLGREDRVIPKDDGGLSSSKRTTKLAHVHEDGVVFQSYVDGSEHKMRPEDSIAIQEALGSDIMMCFDECTPYPATYEEVKKSMELSLRWEKKCLESRTREDCSLFAIVQGGLHLDLRKKCLEELMSYSEEGNFLRSFQGYALGGLSVGEPMPDMYELVSQITPHMPEDKPRYLMGVGMPLDIVNCIDQGIDMFDCVIPTRNARNGMLFTPTGYVYLRQAQYAEDTKPIDENCACYTCKNFSRSYLRHLHMAKEMNSSILSSIHNLHYYMNLIKSIRLAIDEDRFSEFKNNFISNWKGSES